MFQNKFVSRWGKILCGSIACFAMTNSIEGTWTSPVAITETPSDLPFVVVDNAGNAVAIWQGYDGSNYRAEAATLPYGGSWSSEVWLSDAGQDVNTPCAAVDYSGNAVSIWSRWDGVEAVIQATQLPFGGSWTTPENISLTGGNADTCAIAMDFIGDVSNAVAVWHRYNGSNFIIQGAMLPSGGSWTSPADISPSGEDALVPLVAVDPNGNATITCIRYDGTDFDVRSASQLYTQPWGPNFSLSSPGVSTNGPSVNVDESGNAIVAFSQYSGSNYVIFVSTLEPGGSWSEAVAISDTTIDSYQPLVVMEPTGDVVVVWLQNVGSNWILASSAMPAGGSWTSPYEISASDCDVSVYNICIDLSGNATAVWDITDGTNTWVQSSVLPLGGSWSTPVDISTADAQGNSPDVAVDGSGNVVAVWVELNDASNYVLTSATQAFGS